MTASSDGGTWVAAGVVRELTAGGSLRAHHLFRSLIRRTGATVVDRYGARAVIQAVLRRPSAIRGRLATTELFTIRGWRLLRLLLRPAVLDLHDHPILHAAALGVIRSTEDRRAMQAELEEIVPAFRHVVVPTESFADLCGVPGDQRLVIPNGADTSHIRPGPFPDRPTVGLISGAEPRRGIERLIEAVTLVRSSVPETQLRLGLIAKGERSRQYLERLRGDTAALSWVSIAEVPYPQLPEFLAGTTVLAIPHPPDPYLDVAAPVKLFDGMAAGRPVVVTPRLEMARLVTESRGGVVAKSDQVEDLAGALVELLGNPEAARELGGNARRAAVEEFDWRVLGERLADAVLGESATSATGAGLPR